MENGVGGWFSPGNTLALTRVVIDDGCGLAQTQTQSSNSNSAANLGAPKFAAAVSLLRLQMSSLQSELPPNLLARLTEKYGRSQIQFTLIEFMSCLVVTLGIILPTAEYGPASSKSPFACSQRLAHWTGY
ncbi:hypothetical protein R1flu_006765 [Riccia fluitans]|uniref:Uncharacterized protein n=1 Tax=Riccia fluitans TaxID=41844 RepID=A0ABD1YXJ3_9MARC